MLGTFADENGADFVLEDVKRVSDYVRRQYPRLPRFIHGHSMGSFFVRRYLTQYGADVAGAVIMGTGSKSGAVLKIGMLAVQHAIRKEGRDYHNERLHSLVLGSYNRPFEPGKTKHDWLSRDISEARKFEEDPDCRFIFSNGAYEDFFHIMEDLKRQRQFEQIPKTLPVLILSGERDPVGDRGKGVRKVYREFCGLELTDVTMKLYPQARHELLNELNREEVYEDIADWILKRS